MQNSNYSLLQSKNTFKIHPPDLQLLSYVRKQCKMFSVPTMIKIGDHVNAVGSKY